ncbi:MAG: energy-coupling factor transporter ATPase [Ruminococcaceae bacterium]|nr:energy-coupling factor transporter ATPase [Oscillospiraceae bacterium]
MAKIELSGVGYTYSVDTPFEKKAVNNINIEIKEGSITGIIGHTGSGKSTLVQMLNGLIAPTEGKVTIDGVDINADKKKLRDIRFRVGLVFQYPEYQLFEETVERDIAFGPKNMGLSDEEIAERVRNAAKFCSLTPEILKKSPFELSGGQQRRAAIAGVMAMTPEVLILDEPAAGLDPQGRSDIFGGICEYRRKTGATVIIVSHSMEDIARYCERVIVMSKGQVFAHGECDEIFARSAELETIGLDIPQIARVLRRVKELGIDIGDGIYTVGDAYRALLPYIKGGGGSAS